MVYKLEIYDDGGDIIDYKLFDSKENAKTYLKEQEDAVSEYGYGVNEKHPHLKLAHSLTIVKIY